jgi:hypothetical protein
MFSGLLPKNGVESEEKREPVRTSTLELGIRLLPRVCDGKALIGPSAFITLLGGGGLCGVRATAC